MWMATRLPDPQGRRPDAAGVYRRGRATGSGAFGRHPHNRIVVVGAAPALVALLVPGIATAGVPEPISGECNTPSVSTVSWWSASLRTTRWVLGHVP